MLKTFLQQKFRRYPRAAVLTFSPVSMLRCERSTFMKYSIFEGSRAASLPVSSWVDSERSNATYTHYVFPRLGAYRDSEPGVRYEVKLITRSDSVDYVFTHFVSLFSSSAARLAEPIVVPPRQGVLLHYRKNGYVLLLMIIIATYAFAISLELFLSTRGVGGNQFSCEDRNKPLQLKIKADMNIRCANSVPMTLHRSLQLLLKDQPENKFQMKKKLMDYSKKDRLDYVLLGFDDAFVKKLRENYESRLRTVLVKE
jgi:hypothetical protein